MNGNVLKTLLCCSLCILLFSCKDELEQEDWMNINIPSVTFESGADEENVLLEASAAWKASTLADWCFLTPAEGERKGSFVITVAENPDYTPRMTVVSVQAGNKIKEIDVVQKGKEVSVSLSSENLAAYDLNSSYGLAVKTKQAWTATVTGNWLQVEPASGEGSAFVKVKFSVNKSGVERSGRITFMAADRVSKTFEITQGAELPNDREHDSLALVSLFKSITGKTADTEEEPWLNGPIDSWSGVTVDPVSGRVVKVRFSKIAAANGTVTPDIKYLTKMTGFNIDMTSVGGVIPVEIGRCVSLEDFSISGFSYENPELIGNIRGELPKIFGCLQSLKTIDVSGNKLDGMLPEEWANCPYLHTLDLKRNNFNGSLPVFWGFVPHMMEIDVAHNSLVGTVPAEWNNMTNLLAVYFDMNAGMNGQLPALFCQKQGLTISIRGTNILPCEK